MCAAPCRAATHNLFRGFESVCLTTTAAKSFCTSVIALTTRIHMTVLMRITWHIAHASPRRDPLAVLDSVMASLLQVVCCLRLTVIVSRCCRCTRDPRRCWRSTEMQWLGRGRAMRGTWRLPGSSSCPAGGQLSVLHFGTFPFDQNFQVSSAVACLAFPSWSLHIMTADLLRRWDAEFLADCLRADLLIATCHCSSG